MTDSDMSIVSVSKKEKSFKYLIPREPPSRLINPTPFIINFVERKILAIGLDPELQRHSSDTITLPDYFI